MWLIWNWSETLYTVFQYYTPVPAGDYWRPVYDFVHFKSSGIGLLWRQHNEHRILVPEFVFLVDLLADRGRLILPIAISFVCYLAIWIALAAAFLWSREIHNKIGIIAILVSGIVAGSKVSAAVIASPFQLQWTLLELCVALGFISIVRLAVSSKPLYLSGVILTAAIATYSSANGMLLWPLLLASGVLLKLNRRSLFVIAASAVAFISLFFVGYQFSNKLNLGNFISHPFYALGFIGSYLSMPFGAIKSPEFGACLGLSNVALAFIFITIAVRSRLLASPTFIVLLGWYCFTLLTAVVTACGRMDPADNYFGDAKAPRFVTVPLMNWVVLVLICFWLALRQRWKIASAPVIALVCAVLFATGSIKLKWWQDGVANEFSREQATALSVESGLFDPMALRRIFPQPEFLYPLLDYMRAHRLGVFASHRRKWLGQPVDQFARKLTIPATGEISTIFPLKGGLEVAGWTDNSGEHNPPTRMLLSDENDRIVGFGEKLPAGFPNDFRAPNIPYSLGWVGYVNSTIGGQTYSAYLVSKAGLAPIRGSFSAPPISPVDQNQVGSLLPNIEWNADPSWTLNGEPSVETFGVVPSGKIYASWSGNDRNTGQIVSSPFTVPSTGCLILPVLHGPSAGGQSIEITDAETRQLIQSVPMRNGDMQWEFWKFSVPAQVKHVRITAKDEGKLWGQWTAIASPAACL